MSDVIYRTLLENSTWSYSRIKCFEDCRYKFYLKYIHGLKEKPMWYASYGSFVHKLLEQYYKGNLTKEEMQIKYLFDFQKEVKGEHPAEGIVRKYIEAGQEYLESFKPFPYNMVDVEKEVHFKVGNLPFVGYIDYLGEKCGEFYIVDNKSRDLKPRSGRATQTVKDRELDETLKQLYLYAGAVKQEYGKFPKKLCFNCFKINTFIEEDFNEKTYDETVKWAEKCVEEILDTEDFYPNIDFFGCNYICGVYDECCYKGRGGIL